MEFTTCLELHSQATRLSREPDPPFGAAVRACHPLWEQSEGPCSNGLGLALPGREAGLPYATFPSAVTRPGIRRWAQVSLFARRY